jgi:hypothetical protein
MMQTKVNAFLGQIGKALEDAGGEMGRIKAQMIAMRRSGGERKACAGDAAGQSAACHAFVQAEPAHRESRRRSAKLPAGAHSTGKYRPPTIRAASA